VLVALTVPVVLTAFDSVVYVSGNDMGKDDFKSFLQSISCRLKEKLNNIYYIKRKSKNITLHIKINKIWEKNIKKLKT